MRKRFLKFGTLILVALCTTAISARPKQPVDYVNPYMGNISHLLVPTFPTIHLPNSLLRVYPDRADFTGEQINGLPIAVTSHRGSSAFNLSVIQGDESNLVPIKQYCYDNEKITPYSYSANLDSKINVNFAPSHRAAVYQFDFENANLSSYIVLNVGNGFLEATGNTISGYQVIDNTPTKIYLYVELLQQAISSGSIIENKFVKDQNKTLGANQAVVLKFDNKTAKLNLRYGISMISVNQAKINLMQELTNYNVEEVAKKGKDVWNKTLSKIKVNGGSTNDKVVFYTSLYRTYERMVSISEGDKYYSPYDGKIHNNEGHNFYSDDWIWDTYRAVHPLRVLIEPEVETDILVSYVRMAQQSTDGWMPTFPEITGDTHRMNGNHAIATIWDAYQKGLRGFDLNSAFESCKSTLLNKSLLPWVKVPATELDKFYQENGYYPALKADEQETCLKVHPHEKRQPIALTLGDSYDSWCLAQIAKELGKTEDYEFFTKRSFNYRNVYNSETAFFHPKSADGKFIMPFDYRFSGGMAARNYYDENNGWTYRWDVQHQIPDLIKLMGGNEKFVENLDQTFREPLGKSKYEFYMHLPDNTGTVGQFSMGNEPSLHIPYLYNYAGQAWKTQKKIRQLLKYWFRNDLMGIPGDEDGGGMSGFVVFSQMGFYPVTPGSGIYSIGSPIFNNTSIDLGKGVIFKIDALNCSEENKYIQSAKLNGNPLNTPFIKHTDIIKGGNLKLIMGSKPNYNWGK